MFNETCIKEELLPKYTTIYILYVCGCDCVSVCIIHIGGGRWGIKDPPKGDYVLKSFGTSALCYIHSKYRPEPCWRQMFGSVGKITYKSRAFAMLSGITYRPRVVGQRPASATGPMKWGNVCRIETEFKSIKIGKFFNSQSFLYSVLVR